MCDNIFDKSLVDKIKDEMPKDEVLYDLADFFKVFGDSTRIKILYSLFKSEMCVSDIATILNLNQSAVSHQLRLLKNSRLVKYRKKGKMVLYSLDDDHVKKIFDQGLNHINHIED
ncbi:ArsR/SmtB family transcription factor [Abyssisolibacter fermentans]|uniref:ArsR/SmtB family transcription factor n=1 Tax=Abyssisolibacter fermentans TaxID=1766203 RepID=UPI00082D4362|nr:metalloregulator ArsR/SmtB family transcription factor [Abyssisolibacter fermentans]